MMEKELQNKITRQLFKPLYYPPITPLIVTLILRVTLRGPLFENPFKVHLYVRPRPSSRLPAKPRAQHPPLPVGGPLFGNDGQVALVTRVGFWGPLYYNDDG